MNSDALASLAGTLIKIGAPTIGGLLGGPLGAAGGKLAGDIIGSLADALGTEATPEAVQSKIDSDPDAARSAVAAVETAKIDELRLRLADVQDARSTMVRLSEGGSPLAWSSAIVSTIVVLGFVGSLYIILVRPPSLDISTRELALMLLGVLTSKFGTVVDFWLGSSAGSRSKDSKPSDLISRVAQPVSTVVVDAVKSAKRQITNR